VTAVSDALSAAGKSEGHYAGHILLVRAATTAAQCGIHDFAIQTLGRWKSTADVTYIRIPREKLAAISRTLSTPP